jgi:hypothetical protein
MMIDDFSRLISEETPPRQLHKVFDSKQHSVAHGNLWPLEQGSQTLHMDKTELLRGKKITSISTRAVWYGGFQSHIRNIAS